MLFLIPKNVFKCLPKLTKNILVLISSNGLTKPSNLITIFVYQLKMGTSNPWTEVGSNVPEWPDVGIKVAHFFKNCPKLVNFQKLPSIGQTATY